MTVLIVFALLGLFGVLGVFVHPGWAMFGYFAVAFARPSELDWSLFGRSLSLPMVAAAVLGTGVFVLRRGWPRGGSLQMKILTLMLVHFAVSGLILESSFVQLIGHSRPVRPAELWGKFDFYWKMYVVIWLGSRVLVDLTWIQRMLVSFSLCGGFLAVWANYHYFVLHTFPITGPGPAIGIPGGLFADRNDFCILLSMSMVGCWYMATLARNWAVRGAWLAFMPFLLHAILLTESRGGLMGAAGGLAVCAWRSRHRWLFTVGGAVGMAGALLFFTSASLLERYGTIKNYEEDASALGRLNSWNVGWRMMWGNPLFGAGLENYVELFYDYSDWRPTWRTGSDGHEHLVMDTEYEINRARQAHNMWIQRGGETGVLGLAILIWFIASVPVDAFRVRRWLTALRARGAIDEDTHEQAHQLSLCVDGLMVPFLLTGFFLSMEDFEALYLVAMLTGCLTTWTRRVTQAADDSDRARERAWQASLAEAPRASGVNPGAGRSPRPDASR